MFPVGAVVGNVIKYISIETSHCWWHKAGQALEVGIIFLSLELQFYRNAIYVVIKALLSYQTVTYVHPILINPISVRIIFMHTRVKTCGINGVHLVVSCIRLKGIISPVITSSSNKSGTGIIPGTESRDCYLGLTPGKVGFDLFEVPI